MAQRKRKFSESSDDETTEQHVERPVARVVLVPDGEGAARVVGELSVADVCVPSSKRVVSTQPLTTELQTALGAERVVDGGPSSKLL